MKNLFFIAVFILSVYSVKASETTGLEKAKVENVVHTDFSYAALFSMETGMRNTAESGEIVFYCRCYDFFVFYWHHNNDNWGAWALVGEEVRNYAANAWARSQCANPVDLGFESGDGTGSNLC